MLGICCRILSIGQKPGESVEVEDRGKLPLNHNVNVNLVSGKITGRGWIEERLKRDEELEEEKSNGGHWCHTGEKNCGPSKEDVDCVSLVSGCCQCCILLLCRGFTLLL